jgi:hypothetical protein
LICRVAAQPEERGRVTIKKKEGRREREKACCYVLGFVTFFVCAREVKLVFLVAVIRWGFAGGGGVAKGACCQSLLF